MDIVRLFTIQKKLNDRIVAEHKLDGKNLFSEQMLALLVELGELANETRCFKYWSRKQASNRAVILEEYVDGLHFILTIGLSYQFTNWTLQDEYIHESSLTEQLLLVMKNVHKLYEKNDRHSYLQLVSSFLGLGKQLGFTYEEIEKSYLEKNKINHKRQDEGY